MLVLEDKLLIKEGVSSLCYFSAESFLAQLKKEQFSSSLCNWLHSALNWWSDGVIWDTGPILPLLMGSLEVGASFEAQDPKEQLTSTNTGCSSQESCQDKSNHTRSSLIEPQEQGQRSPGSILGHLSSVQQVTLSITRGVRTQIFTRHWKSPCWKWKFYACLIGDIKVS